MTKKIVSISILLILFILAINDEGHSQQNNYVIIPPGESLDSVIRKAANVVPSPQQYAWQEHELIAFAHFGMNTFTDREWGDGTESPALFNLTDFDAGQWVKVLKEAGFRMLILTAKHHDGFCLWPSQYTRHSVKYSPWKNGRGDVVAEVSLACREYGLKFGIYLSPWDKHEPAYGDSPVYNEYFRNQLTELLTNYGDITEVWFDGACGEGPNGKKQVYDWPSYYRIIRKLQPGAVIFGMGPDVRWVGTESGFGRETEWSVIPDILHNTDSYSIADKQFPIDELFIPGDLTTEELGSREKIRNAASLIWYPAETDVSIRPGWFYHQKEDSLVKSPEKLVDIYFSSVGRNSVLLLNIPPDNCGRIHDSDIMSLMGMKKILNQTFEKNFAAEATVVASNERNGFYSSAITDSNPENYWTTDEEVTSASLVFELREKQTFNCIMLQENILVGQRIEKFNIDVWDEEQWNQISEGTTVGYKRLLRLSAITTNRVRLNIEQSRTSPTLKTFGLYKTPDDVE
ncbi:MAG: alpha-L-fucosidase [Bacteroidetes bacterium]|nr:alpha-L-fucosidase [Bacteroidota bacterium]